ncbi:MAG: hypothetical protein ACMG6S_04465 [Byssovorax sp.]
MGHAEHARCWDSVVGTTCAVCMDRANSGECAVPARGDDCPLRAFFPAVLDIVRRTESGSMEAYIAAVETEICPRCAENDAVHGCGRRNRGECGLYAYLPLTVDAIEEALAGPRGEMA